jgi:myo-inositol 2-dehydrogenase / D-chiro-inositol 1-dehydrogenase
MKSSAKGIGLAIVGGGRVGLFRGEVAARHPAVDWIGLAEKNPNRAGEVAPRIEADFVTGDHRELLKRPEVTAAIICTDEHLHVDPIMAGVEAGVPMLIEKPLATDLAQSARMLKAIQDAGLDAVVGYTQRFRRRWLAAKEKCRTGALGDITLVTSRAFMNRLVAIDNYKRTDDASAISPLVISGTHALDICMWCLEGKTPVECYARSVDKVLGPLYGGIDATAGMIMFSDGTVYRPASSRSTTPIAISCLRSPSRSRRAIIRTRAAWSISWAAIRRATWRSASCAVRWRTRRCPGCRAWRSDCRRRLRPSPRRTAI